MELIANICTAILSKQLSDEFKAWTPKIISWLVKQAVKRLPIDERNRYLEEWHSHVNETPGEIGKIVVAIQFLSAARQMSSLLTRGVKDSATDERTAGALAFALIFLAIPAVAPLVLIFALIIKLESRGPCFYRQERIGRKGRKFWLYFFRTFEDLELAPPEKHNLELQHRRTTKFGRVLRFSSLDQIPNLFSIIRGDMAFVGPRPHSPEEIEIFCSAFPNYKEVLKVKPGITGLAQVSGSRNLKEWIDLDLYYVENRSLSLDIKILAKTALVVLSKNPEQ